MASGTSSKSRPSPTAAPLVVREDVLSIDWVWARTADGSARFTLGTLGQNPLVCFGINPSTAEPNDLDPTVTRVSRFAAANGHDSWSMLNVYPQISTDPRGVDLVPRPGFKEENERQIQRLIGGRKLTLLAGWGVLISSRPYLGTLLRDIVTITSAAGCEWVSLGKPLTYGHPRHPSRAASASALIPFDVDTYVRAL